MLKKILATLLCAILCFSCLTTFAEESETTFVMKVVNCNEWVSLRARPDKASDRLATVRLGEVVHNCQAVSDEFILCAYDGQMGYILSEYLAPVGDIGVFEKISYDEIAGMFEPVLNEEVNGLTILAQRDFVASSEILLLGAFDADKNPVWGWRVHSLATELTILEAFIGGTAEKPLVMLNNAGSSLFALDPATGEMLWSLADADVNLGGSISYAIAEDGTMYIGGFYGPDPVAISADGEVLWQASAGSDDIFWLHQIEITDSGILATYDRIDNTENGGQVLYDMEGNVVSVTAN